MRALAMDETHSSIAETAMTIVRIRSPGSPRFNKRPLRSRIVNRPMRVDSIRASTLPSIAQPRDASGCHFP
jgi:hypothetical protein